MRKLFTFACSVLMALSTMASQRYIYYWGSSNQFPYPSTANESYFDGYKFYETAEGSNIYEGTISHTCATQGQMEYFRFYKKLSTPRDNVNLYLAHVISPVSHTEQPLTFNERPDQAVAPLAYDAYYNLIGVFGSWCHPVVNGTYKYRVDLNNNTLTLTRGSIVPLINKTTLPADLSELKDITEIGTIYQPAGKLSLLFYDFGRNVYLGYQPSITAASSFISIGSMADGAPIEVENWNGGLLSFTSNGVTLERNDEAAEPFTGVLVIKDSSPIDLTSFTGDVSAIAKHFTTLAPTGDGSYVGALELDRNTYIRFAECENGTVKAIYGCDADQMTSLVAKRAYSRVKNGATGAWGLPKGNYDIYFNPAKTDYTALQISEQLRPDESCIYIIGSQFGWITPAETYAELLRSCRLFPTTSGTYYGGFYIEAGQTIFRFYSALTGWGEDYYSDSWGCQKTDAPIDFDFDGDETYTLVNGKGSYNLPSWQGGMLYMNVNMNEGWVRITSEPQNVTMASDVPPALPELPAELEYVNMYNKANGQRLELNKIADGVYRSGNILFTPEDINEYVVLGRELPISQSEPEWGCSYAFSFSDDVARFDEVGVATASFTYRSGISTQPVSNLKVEKLSSLPGTGYSDGCYVTLDMNAGKIYLDQLRVMYLSGTLTGGVIPDYSNYKEYASALFDPRNNRIFDIPAGELEIRPSNLYYGVDPFGSEVPSDFTLGENGIAKFPFTDLNSIAEWIKGTWPGGNMYYGVSTDYEAGSWQRFTILARLDEMDLKIYDSYIQPGLEEQMHLATLKLTDPQTLTYEGDIISGTPQYSNEKEWYAFAFLGGMSSLPVAAKNITPFVNSHAEGNIILGSNGIKLPLKEGTKLHLTMSLITGKADFDIVEGEALNSMSLFSSNARVAERSLLEDPQTPGELTSDVYISKQDGFAEFNIGVPDGTVIAPAGGDTEVVFDATGHYECDYVKVGAPQSVVLKAQVRAAAAQAGKWLVNYEFSTYGGIDEMLFRVIVDENNQKLHIYRFGQVDGFYLVKYPDHSIGSPDIKHFADYPMTLNDEGEYVASIDLGPKQGFAIANAYDGSSYHGLVDPARASGYLIPYVLDEPYTMEMASYPDDYYITRFYNNDPEAEGAYHVVYSPKESTVTITYGVSGIDAIDQEQIEAVTTIRPTAGGIVVSSSVETVVTVYNLQGSTVRSVKVPTGTTTIDLPAGLYIAGGHKILVK